MWRRNRHDKRGANREWVARTVIERTDTSSIVRDPERGGRAMDDPPRIDEVGISDTGNTWQVGDQIGLLVKPILAIGASSLLSQHQSCAERYRDSQETKRHIQGAWTHEAYHS